MLSPQVELKFTPGTIVERILEPGAEISTLLPKLEKDDFVSLGVVEATDITLS